MTRDHRGMIGDADATLVLQHAQDGEGDRHQRGLRVFGQREGLGRTLEHQLGQALLEGLVHLVEDLARGGKGRGEVTAHAHGLATLAGEDEGIDVRQGGHGGELTGWMVGVWKVEWVGNRLAGRNLGPGQGHDRVAGTQVGGRYRSHAIPVK